jgi:hypothetical protein
MVFYYQMIYFPETDNTVSTIPVMVSEVTIIIQCTMTLTLCINVAWCHDKPASCFLTHPIMSILLHCLMLTARLFPLLAGRVPRLPKWRPFTQDPHIPHLHRPLHLYCKQCLNLTAYSSKQIEPVFIKYVRTWPSQCLATDKIPVLDYYSKK